jgi:hypothetical protein
MSTEISLRGVSHLYQPATQNLTLFEKVWRVVHELWLRHFSAHSAYLQAESAVVQALQGGQDAIPAAARLVKVVKEKDIKIESVVRMIRGDRLTLPAESTRLQEAFCRALVQETTITNLEEAYQFCRTLVGLTASLPRETQREIENSATKLRAEQLKGIIGLRAIQEDFEKKKGKVLPDDAEGSLIERLTPVFTSDRDIGAEALKKLIQDLEDDVYIRDLDEFIEFYERYRAERQEQKMLQERLDSVQKQVLALTDRVQRSIRRFHDVYHEMKFQGDYSTARFEREILGIEQERDARLKRLKQEQALIFYHLSQIDHLDGLESLPQTEKITRLEKLLRDIVGARGEIELARLAIQRELAMPEANRQALSKRTTELRDQAEDLNTKILNIQDDIIALKRGQSLDARIGEMKRLQGELVDKRESLKDVPIVFAERLRKHRNAKALYEEQMSLQQELAVAESEWHHIALRLHTSIESLPVERGIRGHLRMDGGDELIDRRIRFAESLIESCQAKVRGLPRPPTPHELKRLVIKADLKEVQANLRSCRTDILNGKERPDFDKLIEQETKLKAELAALDTGAGVGE